MVEWKDTKETKWKDAEGAKFKVGDRVKHKLGGEEMIVVHPADRVDKFVACRRYILDTHEFRIERFREQELELVEGGENK